MKSKAHNPQDIPSITECLTRVEQIFAAGRGASTLSADDEIERSITRAAIFAILGDNAKANEELAQADVRIESMRNDSEIPTDDIPVRLQRATIFAIQGKPRKTRDELRGVVALTDVRVANGFMASPEVASALLSIALVTSILERQRTA